MTAEPTPTTAPRMPPIQPHIWSRRLLTPSPRPTGVSMSGTLRFTRRVDRLQRVSHEPLRTADSAWNVEPPIEAAEVLRRLERLLERGLRETEGGPEPLELARIDLRHRVEVSGLGSGTRLPSPRRAARAGRGARRRFLPDLNLSREPSTPARHARGPPVTRGAS